MNERKRKQLERRRVRRNRRILMVAAIVCVFILGLICGGHMVSASRHLTGNQKYYKEIQVDLDETLWDIANAYSSEEYLSLQEYITEVREINSLCSTEIQYGQRLLIPYYSSKPE